jgi:hypothetical protein
VAERSRSRVVIREILDQHDPAFRAAHALLRASFHRAEMLPLADWRNAMRERQEALWTDVNWHLLVAESSGTLLAACSGSYLGNLNVGVVGYIAVKSTSRSSGLGPRMRTALHRRFEADARVAGHKRLSAIVGEVREDNRWLRHLVREGAIALDFPYFQPSLGGGRDVVPLVLYYQPLGRSMTALDTARLRRLLYSMWRRSYRVGRPLADPAFRRMLKSLEGRRRVGQRRQPARRARSAASGSRAP